MGFWTEQRVVVTGGTPAEFFFTNFEDGLRQTIDWSRAARASQLLST